MDKFDYTSTLTLNRKGKDQRIVVGVSDKRIVAVWDAGTNGLICLSDEEYDRAWQIVCDTEVRESLAEGYCIIHDLQENLENMGVSTKDTRIAQWLDRAGRAVTQYPLWQEQSTRHAVGQMQDERFT